MTYEQIEKEFDEQFPCQEHYLHYQVKELIKSFIKQSFIKYLQGEVERLEKLKRDNVFIPDHTPSMHGGLICKACGGQEDCDCETYNLVIDNQITYITNQIKELEV